MKEVLTTAEANRIVYDQARNELKRTLKMLSNYIEKIDKLGFDEFSNIGNLSHQAMREAYMIFGLQQSAWYESESKRPMTELEKQLEESRKKVGDDN